MTAPGGDCDAGAVRRAVGGHTQTHTHTASFTTSFDKQTTHVRRRTCDGRTGQATNLPRQWRSAETDQFSNYATISTATVCGRLASPQYLRL